MGTRSIIVFQSQGVRYLVIYQQYDGYPSGVGKVLVNFIKSKKFVNGYNDKETQFNGFGCFLAQYICHIKNGEAGNAYIYPITQELNEEFNYTVTWVEGDKPEDDHFTFKCGDSKEMTLDEFEQYCEV